MRRFFASRRRLAPRLGAYHAPMIEPLEARQLLTVELLHTLHNPTPAHGDRFGGSVAVSGNTVVAGAYRDDAGAEDTGSVYIFDMASGTLLHMPRAHEPVRSLKLDTLFTTKVPGMESS